MRALSIGMARLWNLYGGLVAEPKRGAVVLFFLFGAIYACSPNRDLADSRYSLLVSHEIWHRGSISLDAYAPPPWGSADAVPVATDLPYQLFSTGDHVYHYFPIGTPLLIAPAVGMLEWMGLSIVDGEGRYDGGREAAIQHLFAALASAALVALIYLSAISLLDVRRSLLLASAVALATPLWSVAAATLWTHTLSVLLLGIVLLQLVRTGPTDALPSPGVLGTLLAWSYFVRPIAAISSAAILLYLAFRWRWDALKVAAVAAGWLAIFLLWSFSIYGALLPPYYRGGRLLALPIGEALLGNLVSPSRGVLIYVPALIYLAGMLGLYWRSIPHRALATTSLAVCAVHFWAISSLPHWWGGHSWGPRLMTDVTPWWAVLAILGSSAHPFGRSSFRPSRTV